MTSQLSSHFFSRAVFFIAFHCEKKIVIWTENGSNNDECTQCSQVWFIAKTQRLNDPRFGDESEGVRLSVGFGLDLKQRWDAATSSIRATSSFMIYFEGICSLLQFVCLVFFSTQHFYAAIKRATLTILRLFWPFSSKLGKRAPPGTLMSTWESRQRWIVMRRRWGSFAYLNTPIEYESKEARNCNYWRFR